jgi:N-acetylneuraminic acid mutarotase
MSLSLHRLRAVTCLSLISCAVSALIFTQPALAQGTWETKAPIPDGGAFAAAGGVINGVWYVVGGSPPGGYATTKLQAYDAVANTWTTKAPAGTPRTGMATGVLNNKLHVAGGAINGDYNNPTLALEIYDPVSDSWMSGAPMTFPRAGMASAAIGGKLYAAGGQGGYPYDVVNTLEIYDAATDSWSVGAPMPVAVGQVRGAAINGKFYVAGGNAASGGVDSAVAVLQIYDPVSNTWTMGAPMSGPRHYASDGVIADKLYVAGGVSEGYAVKAALEVYDPVANA